MHPGQSCFFLLEFFSTLADKKNKLFFVKKKKRYSKDYKFRPAASPVITEYLKDGRMRLRGALPEQTPLPPPVAKTKKRPKAGKASGKRKSSGTKFKPKALNQERM